MPEVISEARCRGSARRSLRSGRCWLPMLALVAAACPAAIPPPASQPQRTPGSRESVQPFRVIAHRGASAYAPENTRPAFQRALELGVRHVELDIGISADGALVLFHDSTLDAKTNLSGPLASHDLATLQEADIGSWFDRTHPGATRRFAGTPLLSLEDLFSGFGRHFYYHVEIKGREPSIPTQLLQVIRSANLEDSVTVTSFRREQLVRMHLLDPEIPLTWLLDRETRMLAPGQSSLELRGREIEAAKAAGFSGVAIRAAELSPEMVSIAHARGLRLRAWGIRDDADVARVLAAGADGMTVDWPDRVPDGLKER